MKLSLVLIGILGMSLLVTFSTTAVAQESQFAEFTGRVIDACSGRGIKGATIGFIAEDGENGASSTTNRKGKGTAGSLNIEFSSSATFYAEVTRRGKTSRMEYLIEDLEEKTYRRRFFLVRRNRCR